MVNFYSKNIFFNYVKLASLLLASLYVPVVSCAAVNPAVSDVLTAVGVPAVTSVPDVAVPILLMTTNLLFFVPIISDITVVVNVPAVAGVPTCC